jgi:PAS domain S-box-containing protein
MIKTKDTHDALVQENTLLKMKVDKLTSELGRQLEANVEYFLSVREKNKNITEHSYTNRMLLSIGKMIEERYRVMAENIDEILSIVDIEGIYIYANHKAAELHGLNIKDMLGKSIFEIMGKEFGEQYKREIFDPVTKENRDAASSAIINRANKKIHLKGHCHPIHDDRGEVIGVLNISHDHTADKKQSEYLAIEQSVNLITSFSSGLEQTIQDIFFKLCSADCIFAGGLYLFYEERQTLELICHFNLSETFVSQVMSYGIDSPQYAIASGGIPHYEILPELSDDALQEFGKIGKQKVSILPLVHGKQIVGCLNLILNGSEQITREDKAFIETIAWRIARIIDLHEAQIKLNRTVEELNETISDLKIKQQMLIQKSKMESLGELSAGMAHEINQPLVIISLSIENILQKMTMGEKHLSSVYLKRKFESILLNVNRIQQIINNMRIFARDQSSILFKKVSIGEVISKTLEMVSVQFRGEGIKITYDEIEEKAYVLGNIFKMEQVLLNLLSNSRYAVNEKSKRNGDPAFQKQIEIKAIQSKYFLNIEVIDNGIGISQDHIEKLFTPFFTTKREDAGTGLGLPIVYGIVKEMNGDINVTSKENEFTSVRIVLPAV